MGKSWTPQTKWNHVFRKEWAFLAPYVAPVTIYDNERELEQQITYVE